MVERKMQGGSLKVKRLMICMLLVLLSTGFVHAEVTAKRVSDPEGIVEYVFYSDGKEVARESWDKNGNRKVTGKIPDGVVKEYYESGELKVKAIMKDGKLEGVRKTYHKNGKLRSKSNYKSGVLDGIAESYYESGKLRTKSNFVNGKLEGVDKEYYESGKLKAEKTAQNGKWAGMEKEYYENGKLKYESNYRNGEIESISKMYYESGELWLESKYKYAQLYNEKEYDKKGNLISERNYPVKEKKK